jgi:hypothetical protein
MEGIEQDIIDLDFELNNLKFKISAFKQKKLDITKLLEKKQELEKKLKKIL